MDEVIVGLQQGGIVPVVVLDRVEDALPLTDALLAGGLSVIEVTLRTGAAIKSLELIASQRPEMLVGAGTVLSADDVDRVKDAGATFALAPGLNEQVVEVAAAHEIAFFPGVLTPSEIERALSLGCRCLKFFPAGSTGGASSLATVAGPYAHTGVQFIPTGGVSEKDLASYVSLPTVTAVGGSFLATRQDIADRNWAAITAKASAARQAIDAIRNAPCASVSPVVPQEPTP